MQGDRWGAVLVSTCVLLTLAGRAEPLPAQEPAAAEPLSPPAQPFASPRQLLALLDVDDRDWAAFQDHQPPGPHELEPLVKILYRWPWISDADIALWQHSSLPAAALHQRPQAARGELFPLQGRVRSLTRRPLPPRQAALFEFGEYFELDLRLADGDGPAIVLARTVPEAWQTRSVLDERARAAGLFLKVGPPSAAGEPLWFAAPRVAWFPDQIAPGLGIGPDQVWLAGFGMDIGLFDTVRPRNRSPISAEERECFYALLQTVRRAGGAALERQARHVPLADLLQHPEREHGSVIALRGTVRRITRVVVDDPEVRAHDPLSTYYQLDVLVPLHGQTIEVRDPIEKVAGPVYHDVFPCTVCALELPAAWYALAGAPHVSQPVELAGVFFKLWAYQAPYVESFDPRQRQLSPLLIAQRPTALAADRLPNARGGLIVGLGFLVLLAGLWWLAARMHHGTRRSARRAPPAALPIGIRPEDEKAPDPDPPSSPGAPHESPIPRRPT